MVILYCDKCGKRIPPDHLEAQGYSENSPEEKYYCVECAPPPRRAAQVPAARPARRPGSSGAATLPPRPRSGPANAPSGPRRKPSTGAQSLPPAERGPTGELRRTTARLVGSGNATEPKINTSRSTYYVVGAVGAGILVAVIGLSLTSRKPAPSKTATTAPAPPPKNVSQPHRAADAVPAPQPPPRNSNSAGPAPAPAPIPGTSPIAPSGQTPATVISLDPNNPAHWRVDYSSALSAATELGEPCMKLAGGKDRTGCYYQSAPFDVGSVTLRLRIAQHHLTNLRVCFMNVAQLRYNKDIDVPDDGKWHDVTLELSSLSAVNSKVKLANQRLKHMEINGVIQGDNPYFLVAKCELNSNEP